MRARSKPTTLPDMKLLKLLLPLSVILCIAVSISSVTLSSCTKTLTIIKTDTLVQLDTVYCLKCGLVAYYNFNNGNLNDSSGNGNNITFNNATPTADRFGNPNNA
jgi:hypothetical protein